MKGITVSQLLKTLKEEEKLGHGNYVVFFTDDEEANGYHACWFPVGQTPASMDPDTRKFVEDSNGDLSILKNKDEAYFLG